MSAMPMKQRAGLAIAGVIVLYAIAALTWFMYADEAWSHAEKRYNDAVKTQTKERKLIRETDEWNAAYEEERAKMPFFAADNQGVDTKWQGVLGELATTTHVSAPSYQNRGEETSGDVSVYTVEMKNCECALSSLVKFLHGIQTQEGTMMDVSSIDIRPVSQHQGFLKCSFTVACAYMRGEK